jgi:hypothetical protein
VGVPGFAAQTTNVTIHLGHEATLHFELAPSAVVETIDVTAPSVAPLEASAIPVHSHIERAEIEGLPINRRDFLGFALFDSGIQRDSLRVHAVAVTSGFNVMGQRPRANSLQLDGADLNDETTGGMRSSVPMEAVQEFQVLTSGYQAEYGRASGGVVNVITKSGGNEFHGSVFGFLRHRSLDATNAFSLVDDPPYTRVQYGASLSGPLQKDRTFFYVAFEQLRRQESGFSRIALSPQTFSLTPAQQALKAVDPTDPAILAAERGLEIARTGLAPLTHAVPDYRITPLENLGGIYPVSQRLGSYSLRLDHELRPAHRLAARFNYAHDKLSSMEAQNNDQISGLISLGRTAALTTIDPTAVLSLSSTFGTSAVNELRFSWARRRFDMRPNSYDTPVNISGVAFIGREPILPHTRTERHIHVQDTVMLSVGRHLLKFGGDLMLCPTEVEYHRQLYGLFNFGPQPAPGSTLGAPPLTPVQAYGLGLPANFFQQFGDPRADADKTSAGVFLQDSWRVASALTLDLGMRYDVESAEELSPSNPALSPLFGQLAIRRSPPTDWNNLQPRIGFNYQALSNGRLVVRGSYGLFYDRLLNLSTYLSTVGDGGQVTRLILTGSAATDVFHLPTQKLASYPGGDPPTGLVAFSRGWALGYTEQGNLSLSTQLKQDLVLDAGYVWVKGSHLPRSRDRNPTDGSRAAAFLAAGHAPAELLQNNYFRPHSEAAEVMTFEDSASSIYHGLRLTLRGHLNSRLFLNASYTFSKALDDAEEIFPHSRAQDMQDFGSERSLALYDQRQKFILSALYELPPPGSPWAWTNRMLGGWIIAPILELASGRPVNVLLGFDNNLDQYPSSDRPDLAAPGDPRAVVTRYGEFVLPGQGLSGNLGRNAFIGPGFASLSLRFQKNVDINESLRAECVAEVFNLFNRTNVRTVNPNYQQAGEPLTAFDPRQIQFGLRLRF